MAHSITYDVQVLTESHPRKPHVDPRMTHYISATSRGLTLGRCFHAPNKAAIYEAKLSVRAALEREFEAWAEEEAGQCR